MTYFVIALALVLGLSQCKKEQTNNQNAESHLVPITLNVNGGNSNSRVIVDPAGAEGYATVNFETNDVIYVGYNNACVGTLTYSHGTFSGSVEIPESNYGGKLHFYFLGGVGFTPTIDETNNTATVNISNQTTKYPVISYAPSKQAFTGAGAYSAKLQNKVSIMKFNVTTPSTAPICITGMNNKVTLNFDPTTTDTDEGFSYSMDADDNGLIKMPAPTEGTTWAIVLPQPALEAGQIGTAYTEDTDESNCYLGLRPAISPIGSNEYIIVNENDEPITMTVNIPKYVNLDGKYWYNGGNGQVLYNTGSSSMSGRLYIQPGATVTLRNVNIHGGIDACDQPGDTCTIILEGENHVDSETNSVCAAVHTQNGTTMVIKGTGTLHATAVLYGAGIGAAPEASCGGYGECGNIRIEGGTIYATGGQQCAGIGGMYWDNRPCGDITITGGEVHAIGGSNGAPGIGSGCGGVCGNILISGGTVVAEGTGSGPAGIGTAMAGTCGNITITNTVTKVTAIKSSTATRTKCIGLGATNATGSCGTITIGDDVYDGSVAANQSDNKTYIYEP